MYVASKKNCDGYFKFPSTFSDFATLISLNSAANVMHHFNHDFGYEVC